MYLNVPRGQNSYSVLNNTCEEQHISANRRVNDHQYRSKPKLELTTKCFKQAVFTMAAFDTEAAKKNINI